MTTEARTLQSTDNVVQTLNRLTDTARADAVFGHPEEHNGNIVIPCSEVMSGLGIGFGSGPTSEDGKETRGGGAGGGGGSSARPVAAIVISQDGVRVQPIVDVTKIALASLTAGTFILLQLFQLFRQSRRKNIEKPPSLKKLKKAIG